MKIKQVLPSSLISAAALVLAALTVNGATVVNLGTSADFLVLAKSGISNTGISTDIVGNIGTSPIASTAITGFDLNMDSSGEFATSPRVTGKVFAADYASPTPAYLSTAVSDMETAYTDAAGRTNPDTLNLLDGNLNGQNFAAGLHKWTSAVTITSSITLDGGGDSSAVWIFQIDNRLNLAPGAQILLTNGAVSDNIFWQTAEGATLGTTSHFEGNLLSATDVSAMTGATMNARILAQTGVTLDSNSIVTPVPEPSAYAAIMGLGAIGILCLRRRLKAARLI